jgi:hypothetical protein
MGPFPEMGEAGLESTPSYGRDFPFLPLQRPHLSVFFRKFLLIRSGCG